MLSVSGRSQRMVMGFLVYMWLALVAILIAAQEIYDRLLHLGPGRHLGLDLAFLAVVSVFLAVLATGVARGWTWTFWLVLVAFLAGILRAPVSVLQLTGAWQTDDPSWFVAFQLVVGAIEFAIGLVLAHDYRRAGVWGAGPP